MVAHHPEPILHLQEAVPEVAEVAEDLSPEVAEVADTGVNRQPE